jgi:hypothetical protein
LAANARTGSAWSLSGVVMTTASANWSAPQELN